jgi:hypothetical protein
MGILNKLTNEGSEYSKYDGANIPQMDNLTPNSPLHNQYSINGTPSIVNKPTPSNLDLDGKTPSKYLDNLPT